VSRALADSPKAKVKLATRQRVREAASALGYHPDLLARAVITRKTGALGLLTYEIFDPIHAGFVQGIITEGHRYGYQVVPGLATTSRSEDVLDNLQVQIRQMISRGVDGLLFHTRGIADESRMIREAVKEMLPAAAFSHSVEGVSSVALDRFAGAFEAAEHLIRLGYRRIGFVRAGWGPTLAWQGYASALQSHGLTPEEMLIEDTTLQSGYDMGLWIARAADRPRALICWGDMPAIGICRGLQESGVRVPEDVAVVGFDGSDIGAYCSPPLTTVAQPVEEICRKAIGLLIDQINGDIEVKREGVRPYLMVRKSCGAGGV
jgi:LacI family transcriptional regulator